jgi:hypothetical protein
MLLVLMMGAGAYQRVRDTSENHFSEDTCISYLTMKLRHFDDATGTVYLGDVNGTPGIYMTEFIDEREFVTAIYFYDEDETDDEPGYVRELFAERGYDFVPQYGFEILQVQGLSFGLEDGVVKISCIGTGGGHAETYIALRNWGAVE